MKKIMSICGALMLICGVILFLISSSAQEDMHPKAVSVGYMDGDTYVVTRTGSIGGNPEGLETTEQLKTVGILCGLGGLVSLVVSFTMKGEENGNIY